MDNQQCLLNEDYYNCPGCKADRQKELQSGLPIKQVLTIWVIVLASSLTISSLFPFLYFMIRDFHIAKSEEDIGYYAGYIGSSYMLGRALTSIMWGAIADKFGRKPVIIIGSAAVVVFNTLFGLSTNFWMAISTRFLLGSLNGVLGATKAYASEVVREEHQSLGLSTVSTAWGTGLIIGPALGGFLAQVFFVTGWKRDPAENFPAIFASKSIFGRFPYFLPCLIISLFALLVTIACLWLPETLHTHNSEKTSSQISHDALESASPRSNDKVDLNKGSDTTSKESLFKNWPLMSSIMIYCVFSLRDMAYTEVFSLWAVSPRRLGGLSYSTLQFRILSIPLLTSYHYIGMLSGITLSIVLNFASLVMNVLSASIDTSLFILQNRAVDQHQRGAANGIAMTLMSLFKTVGPAGGGTIFSWAEKRQDASFLPGSCTMFTAILCLNVGDQMVFFLLNIVELVAVLMTFKPFLVQRTL